MNRLISALIVPFDKSGKIMEQELRQIVKYNLEEMKVKGLYVGGSTGENFMLETKEKKRIFEIVADEVSGKTTLIAQVGSLNLKEACELGKLATDLNYNYLSAVTPFYYRLDLNELKNYYQTIIEHSKNEMIIYYIPSVTGVTMTVSDLKELLSMDNVYGVKYTCEDFYLFDRLKNSCPDKALFFGLDHALLPAITFGADGAIGTTYNITGKIANKIVDNVKDGNLINARELQRYHNSIMEELFKIGGYFQAIKEVLKLKGIDAGYCKKPLKILGNDKIEQIKDIAKKYSL